MSRIITRSAALQLALRLGVAAALLIIVFKIALPADQEGKPGGLAALRAAFPSEGRAAWGWFALSFLVIGLGFVLNAWRFRGLLRASGMPARWAQLFRAYLVAGFFNLVLPGAILGDAYRVVDARRDTGRASSALGLIVLERLLGLSALGAIGLVTMPLVPLDEADAWLTWILFALSGSFLVGTFLTIYPRTNTMLRRVVGALSRISARVAESGDRVLAAVGGMWVRPRAILQTFGLSLISQGLLILSIWLLSQPLASQVDWYWFPVIVPFATLVSLVPISIGAAGVREYLYVTLFGAAGMEASSALALSLSVFAATLAWGLVGLAIFISGKGKTASAAPA